MRKKVVYPLVAFAIVLLALAAWVAALNVRDEADIPRTVKPFEATPGQIERGAYLALAGDCAGCHTARGGAAYAGGRGIDTPFGTVYAPNLTADAKTGIGDWSAAEFWRAMHNGRARNGRLLSPAFPYPSFTQVTREDSDAIHAYLRNIAPIEQHNRPHTLRFPYNTQAALAVWRALFFEPGVFEPEAGRSAEWNRGAYLVRGLGHCIACHSSRNALGASIGKLELSGGLIPMQGWYAPSLASADEAGVADWKIEQVVDLLKSGVSDHGSVIGPMAEVVARSTQHLSEQDLGAMAVFLKELPQARTRTRSNEAPDTGVLERGGKIYAKNCAECHGDQGQGAMRAYVPLAGNRAVTMPVATNLIRIVQSGGFAPSTAGNPRPYGMPPFGQELNDADIASVLSYIRASWGNDAAPVSTLDVHRAR